MKPCYNTDKLYLLEILVSNLCIDYDKLGLSKDTLDTLKQIIVICEFQNFPELQIREDEFCKDRGTYENVNEVVLRTGKSCLFSARGLAEGLEYLLINVKVVRERESGGSICLGTTCVQLDCHFVDVLKNNSAQKSRSMDETYPIYSDNCCCIGSISMSVRLSSLGKMILTSVQGGKGNEPFVVKGEGIASELGAMGDFQGLLGGVEQSLQEGFQQAVPVMQGMTGVPYGNVQGTGVPFSNVQGMQQSMLGVWNIQRIGGQKPSPFCGHVPIRSSSSSSEEEPPPPPPAQWPPGMFCSCEYPLPPGFENPPPPPPPKKKKKKKKKKDPCPFEMAGDYCLNTNCPMGYRNLPTFPQKKSREQCAQFPLEAGSIGLSSNQMMFQWQQQQQQQDLARPGPNTQTLEDDKNDIYILKIGSKHQNKKPKLLLELKTPKLKFEDVKTQETDSQYREEDFTLPEPPKETKKPKKGKKGKGKKGKK